MKKIISIVLVVLMAMTVMAVPAKRDGVVRIAADGSEKTVYVHGNEFFHYLTDAEGNWLDEETLLPMSEEVKNARIAVSQSESSQAKARRAKEETGTSRLLAPRGAVILVSYSDKAFSSTNEEMKEWAMGDDYMHNGATGSIHQYFLDQSWGEYDLQIDVFGPVVLSKELAYYGSNNSQGDDKHVDELVKEACTLAHDSCGADFSLYDFDNNGKVDWVVIIYAGYGEASGAPAETVWPHQYDLSYIGKSFYLDGKKVDHYCCLNELTGTRGTKRDGIGTFCHEFSHVMGLPDLYATNDATHHTLCEWDVMDYGAYNNNGNTPPCYSAYERWFMGWITPRVLTEPEFVTLQTLNESKESLLMCEGDAHNLDGLNPNPKNFYLIENRVKEGWDKYLPGEGMLLTKINYSYYKWSMNIVNNTKSSMGVDLIEAKANTTSGFSAKGKATDAFPDGASEYTEFEGHEITDIDWVIGSNTIQFSYRGAEPQGIDDIEDGKTAKKIIRDGQVLIIRDGKTYDVLGNRL